MNLDQFTQAYITAALWSSTDYAGEPLDNDYDASDVCADTLASMRADCADFIASNKRDLAAYARFFGDNEQWSASERAGHDFWLTRNGHGAGFWDRGLPGQLGQRLTANTKPYGSVDLHVSDDGMVRA